MITLQENELITIETTMTLTVQQVQHIVPTLTEEKAQIVQMALNSCMYSNGITEPLVQAMFIAQTAHESDGYVYTKEIASGEAYEGREDLGNTSPGDGVKYKGRGYIQVTGKVNYIALMMDACIDCVEHPEILEEHNLAALSAAWFWKTHNCTELCGTGTDEDFVKVTRRINGGENGLDSRRAYWARAKEALGL